MPKKPTLDPSDLLEEDPEFAEFVRIFCRYFYGRKWLKEKLYRDASFYLGFPISLNPKDAAIPISKLADIFRYYFENGEDPDPEVLMENLRFSSKRYFDSSLLSSTLGIWK